VCLFAKIPKTGILQNDIQNAYSRICVTAPAPTVLPPSRIAKTESNINSNRVYQVNCNCDVVAGHYHFPAFRECYSPVISRFLYRTADDIVMEWCMAPPSSFFRTYISEVNFV